jgi:hypothetical protein
VYSRSLARIIWLIGTITINHECLAAAWASLAILKRYNLTLMGCAHWDSISGLKTRKLLANSAFIPALSQGGTGLQSDRKVLPLGVTFALPMACTRKTKLDCGVNKVMELEYAC